MKNRRVRSGVARASWHAFLAVCAVVSVFPVLWMVLTSLKDHAQVFEGNLLPDPVVVDGYITAWRDMAIWRNFLNSLFVTSTSVVLIVIVSTLAGYAFGRMLFIGRAALFALLVSALFIPAVATLIPTYVVLRTFGLLGSHVGLILVYVAAGVPFSTFLMSTFFRAIPEELTESARLDGANEWQIFRSVMLPLALPGVATIAIFQMLNVWNDLLTSAALVPQDAMQTLQPAASRLVGEFLTDYPGLAATMTLSVLPMLLMYVIFQKWFVRGLTAGALKA